MAEDVIDVLEVIEVDEQNGVLTGTRSIDRSRYCGVEGHPVGQARKAVQRGLRRQLLVDLTCAQGQGDLVGQVLDGDDRFGGHAARRAEDQPRAPVLLVYFRQR